MSEESFEACLDYLRSCPERLNSTGGTKVVGEYTYGFNDSKVHCEIAAEASYRKGMVDYLEELGIPSKVVNKGRVYEVQGKPSELLVLTDFDGVKQFRGILPGNTYLGLAVIDEKGIPLGSALIDIKSENLYYTRGPGSQVIFKAEGTGRARRIKAPKEIRSIEQVRTVAPYFENYGKLERHSDLKKKFGPFREKLVSAGVKEIPLSGLGYVPEILEGRLDIYNTSNEHDLDKVRIVSDILTNAGGVVCQLEREGAESNPLRPRAVSTYGLTPFHPDIDKKIRRGDFLAASNNELYRDALRVINETCAK